MQSVMHKIAASFLVRGQITCLLVLERGDHLASRLSAAGERDLPAGEKRTSTVSALLAGTLKSLSCHS